MTTSGKDTSMAELADPLLIARDYAMMRLEYLSMQDETELALCTEADLSSLADSFHEAQMKILISIPRSERREEFNVTAIFDTKMRAVRARINVKPTAGAALPHSNLPKLPKISIKQFNGKIDNWITFIQLFNSLVHERTDLADVEKLHYLLSSVQNEAHDLVKNYPITNENYMVAYNTLYRHYNKTRLIASTYYERLINCEPVKTSRASDLERVNRAFTENLSILKSFNLPDKNFMLVQLLWSKLDRITKEQFELEHNSDEIPDFKSLQMFIEKRFRALDAAGFNTPSFNTQPTGSKPVTKAKTALVVSSSLCTLCKEPHNLSTCPSFLKIDPNDRFKFVKENRLCILCLSGSHSVKLCKSKQRCEKCQFSHNTLLHFNKPVPSDKSVETLNPSPSTSKPIVMVANNVVGSTLFSTAKVLIRDIDGNLVPIRVLLDCASACNFITEACAKKLGLKIKYGRYAVNGIGQAVAEPAGTLSCIISPSTGGTKNSFSFEAYLLPSICSDMPAEHIDISSWQHTKNLDLADPCLHLPGPIDMLLSVDIFASSLRPGLLHGDPGEPVAINSIFGWILMGGCATEDCRSRFRSRRDHCHVITNSLSLDDSIKRFWELEQVMSPSAAILSKEDQLCEQYFVANFRRTEEGRFVVPLPFTDPSNKPSFSGSRAIALKRFSPLERKLQQNAEFRRNYVAFMDDYEKCRHLERCDPPTTDNGPFFYIPHHGVLRPLSTSTPLRVVFDASAKDAQGTSLNDTLLPGQKLQKNILHLLLRFRWHVVVFTADVKQMYRQILVTPEDAEYQRVLWRPSVNEPIRDYRLLTVTYGVSSAPYQALRSIAQLAQESVVEYPGGSTVLGRDIYVDDIVSGAESVGRARDIRSDLSAILSAGGMHLRKWTSNHQGFFDGVPPEDLYSEDFREFDAIGDVSLKIPGLLWLPHTDNFTFKVSIEDRRCTKRTILSEIARIFDPLGLISPVTFFAKYLMQLLWVSGVAWDDDAPHNIGLEWQALKAQLSSLSSVAVPRRMVKDFVVLQLHGFCDASERGFCAVVYCRTVDKHGVATVNLVCAKSKVAPLRRLSIPRLELLAAVLLSDLMASVVEALKPFHSGSEIFTWSDSSVALAWIKSCPSKWKTFVANRVSHIQEIVPPDCWRHVRTSDNPADCGSRGLLPNDLVNQICWWNGPYWLVQPSEDWPRSMLSVDVDVLDEEQKVTVLVTSLSENLVDKLLARFSSLRTLKHVLAYCFRFAYNIKNKKNKNRIPLHKLPPSPLEPHEIKQALMFLVRFVQEHSFKSEIEKLKNESPNTLPKRFRKLSPFLDDAGLLRVGGRLSRASLDFDVKHPLLLPRDHRLTSLIIDEYHQKFMHPGPQTLQNLLAQHFWILSAKRAIQAVTGKCLKCFRVRPLGARAPFMGDLPSYRVSQIKPFSSAAVDFGGPFDVSLGRGRGNKTYKGYICVFVCTSTKAVHVELATELSAEAFLAALRRFVARRGRCCRLVSDQGKNFVGASNILQRLIKDAAHTDEIRFEFNPPGSPHFSGLAEAGIKAVKTHLSRVVGQQRLTYEEFSTVLNQVEALLNSRPLTPLSTDPNDLTVLTPGHFLTMEPLSVVPDEDLTDIKVSITQRWRMLQKMHQDFWSKWSQEYMHTLQQRMKWHDRQPNLEKGMLVLIVNEQTSPMKWPLGRIVDTHPGSDGVCRVVTVRTAYGLYKRPVVKLCPLPV